MATQDDNDDMAMPKTIILRNFPCPPFNVKNMEAAFDFIPKDGDIVICSFPKTGTTWVQYIIWQILHNEESLRSFIDMTTKHGPYMDIVGIEPIEALAVPRCYRTHFPYNMLKINKNAKYVYIHRNPTDIIVSYYHFTMNVFGLSFTFGKFYERFITGDISYGDYFDHVLSFDLHKDGSHLQIFSYEDLHRDKKGQVLRLAKFLGNEYYEALMEDEIRLQHILDVTNFSYMKDHLHNVMPLAGMPNTERPLEMLRKGIVGDGKNVLSAEQVHRVQQKMLEKMKGTDYVQLWSSE